MITLKFKELEKGGCGLWCFGTGDHQLAHARLLKMSEAIDDMTAYTKLTDHFVIQQIRTSQGTQLAEASCDWTVGVPCCHCVVYLCVPVCVCVCVVQKATGQN